jgi:hypothetical protein
MTGGQMGEQKYRQRQGFLQSLIGQDQALYGDPFLALTGQQSGAGTAGAGWFNAANTGMGYGPRYTNPESPAALDMWNTGYNSQAAGNISEANNRAALAGAGIEAFGNMFGGMMKACWIAREVYGTEITIARGFPGSMKWMVFREWLVNRAPWPLLGFYLRYGERFAGWIRNKPKVKRIIRWLMDRVVEPKRKGRYAV